MKSGIQITICSGNALIRTNLAAALGDLGQVMWVASVEELCARLQIVGSGVVLLDGNGLHGAALRRMASLMRTFGNVQVVVFHLWPARERLQELLAAGAWGALSYTAPLTDYRDAVQTVMQKRKYFSSDIPLFLMKI